MAADLTHSALKAQVAELTALLAERDAAVKEARDERDEARADLDKTDEALQVSATEVTRLTEALKAKTEDAAQWNRVAAERAEALAAAEQSVRDWCKNVREERGRAEAAEARVRELERAHEQALNERDAAHAEMEKVLDPRKGTHREINEVPCTACLHALHALEKSEARLAAANALLDEVKRSGGVGGYPALNVRIDAHLAAQPATTLAQAERLDATEARVRELEAEVERLRTERKERDDMWHRRQENWRSSSDRCLKSAESSFAAANALLERCAIAVAGSDARLAREVAAHLAAQPATAQTQPRQQDMTEDEYYSYQPTAPCQETGVHKDCDCEDPRVVGYETQPTAPTRTEAEQRVLDAMAKTRISEHSRIIFDCAADEHELAFAELARREALSGS